MDEIQKNQSNNLFIIWTSDNKDVAMKMVFMYARNGKKHHWWDRIQVIVWGPSVKLLVQDEELQGHLQILKDFGVECYACITCAEMYGASNFLRDLGIEVIPMGEPVSSMLKEGWKSLTF
ncbi:MAG: DsrE family protein [Eubacteriales bacterium]